MSEISEMNKKARDGVGKKLGAITKPRKVVKTDHKKPETELTADQKVAQMLEKKFTEAALSGSTPLSDLGYGSSEKKSVAAKYYGMPITEILSEQRKAENLLAEAEEKLDSFVNEEYQKAHRRFTRSGGYVAAHADDMAQDYVNKYIVGNSAYESTDPKAYKAHQEYLALRSEFVNARVESNAVLLARQNYIDENQDIIKDEQRKKRVADLHKSGLLKELGVAEEHEENEEGSGNE